MSTTFIPRELIEMSLEDIGATSINERGATAEQLRRGLNRLDLIVAELVGTNRCFWLIPSTVEIAITGATQTYDLMSVLGTSAPDNGIQFPVGAVLEDGETGDRTPLTIITRERYLEKDDPDETGTPEEIYIDRLAAPTMTIFPVPASGEDDFSVFLDLQTYGPSFPTKDRGKDAHEFGVAWQNFLVMSLNARLGSGTVIKLPEDEIRRWEGKAEKAKSDLLAWENRQHDTEPPQVKPWSMW